MPEARAEAKYIRIAPRKVQQVANLIRGKHVDEAINVLKFTPKAAARIILKVVNSAVANAEKNHRLDRGALYVAQVIANQGPTLKRFRHRAMGRASRIHKRTSHIKVVVVELKEARSGTKG